MANLPKLNLMITAVGCPGASTLIRQMRSVTEREIYLAGIDANEQSIGRFWCDAFCQVPMADDPAYVDAVLDFAITEKIDCILVSSSFEVEHLAAAKSRFSEHGILVLTSSPEQLQTANNKKSLYQLFEHDPIVKTPVFKIVNTLEQFVDGCHAMGYPNTNLCFKPPVSKGSRGFRFLAANLDRIDLLLNSKPDNKLISLEEMIATFEARPEKFPELILMETVEGEEIDSMVLANNGKPLLITHKTREKERGGVITQGGHCLQPELDKVIARMLEVVPLSYNFGIQFKGGYLIEINPRLSSFIFAPGWNEPYFAIKLALGEYSETDIYALQQKIPMDTRMIRYFDQYFFERG